MHSNVLVQFYSEPVLNEFKSTEEGRDIYEDREHIRIVVAGSRDEIVRLATPEDRREFKAQYQQYKENASAPVEGTPLAELPGISGSQVKELAFFNVKTVEALADLSESSRAHGLMGVRELVGRAQGYLAKANGDDAAVSKIAAENEALKKRLAAMEAQISAFKGGAEVIRGDGPAADPDADGDGKLSPLERGMQAAREGKPRNVPPAYRGKPAGEEWELGYDDVKSGDKAA